MIRFLSITIIRGIGTPLGALPLKKAARKEEKGREHENKGEVTTLRNIYVGARKKEWEGSPEGKHK